MSPDDGANLDELKVPIGLYEQIISQAIGDDIASAMARKFTIRTRELDAGDSHGYLAQYLAHRLSEALQSFPVQARLDNQVDLVNRVIDLLSAQVPGTFGGEQARVLRGELLLEILRAPVDRPDTPLSVSCLMTGTDRKSVV